jgi:hypothetical protein
VTESLVTAEEVLERLVDIRGGNRPKGLTPEVVQRIVRGVNAQVLQRMGRTTLPTAGVEREALAEVLLELVILKVRLQFFATDPQAIQALNTRWGQLWGTIPEASTYQEAKASGGARSSIAPTRQFKRFTDDNTRVDL